MSSKAYRIPSASDRLRKQQIAIKNLQAMNRVRNTPRPVASTATAGVSAAGDTGGGTGNFLRTAGDTMIGPLALAPPVDFRIQIDSDGAIDIGESSSNSQYTSNIQLDDIQPNTTTLDTIDGAAFDGQILVIRTFAPGTITIAQATGPNGGNIQTLTDSDFTMGNLKVASFIFDESLIIFSNTGGTWREITGDEPGGGGLTEPVILTVNEITAETLPTTSVVDWSLNPNHITLDKDVEFSFDNLPTSGKYEGVLVIIDVDATGGFASPVWPASLTNPPVVPTTANSRTSVMLYTINGGTVVTHATSSASAASVFAPPFPDTDPLIEGSADPTKLMRFEIDGFTTATTRIMTLPNASVTLAGLGVTSQTWTGANTFVGSVAVRDNAFFVQDNADITKQLVYDLNGGTTGFILTLASQITGNRTLTFPDSTTDLAGLGVTSQSWTGTNIFAGNTSVRDTNFFVQQTSDITKQLVFDLSGGTTGLVLTLASQITGNRTLTFPDTTTDLAGLGVTSQSWTGTNDFAGNTAVRDTNFFIEQTSDITKQLKFDIAGATTGQVLTLDSNHTGNRTLTFPDTTTDLAGLGVTSQTWTGTNIFAGNTDVRDTNFSIQNTADNTKEARFDVSGFTTSTIRTLILPNSSTTLAGLGVVSQTWTGTNLFVGVTNLVGNVTIGDATSDTVTINSRLSSNLIPNTDNTRDLGSATLAMDFIYDKSGVAIVEGYITGTKPTGQTDMAILFTVPTAGGKTELRASFQTGASVLIATEP